MGLSFQRHTCVLYLNLSYTHNLCSKVTLKKNRHLFLSSLASTSLTAPSGRFCPDDYSNTTGSMMFTLPINWQPLCVCTLWEGRITHQYSRHDCTVMQVKREATISCSEYLSRADQVVWLQAGLTDTSRQGYFWWNVTSNCRIALLTHAEKGVTENSNQWGLINQAQCLINIHITILVWPRRWL